MAARGSSGSLMDIGSLFSGKMPWKSLTAWGLLIYAMGAQFVTIGAEQGIIGAPLAVTLSSIIEKVGVILTALGVRRAL